MAKFALLEKCWRFGIKNDRVVAARLAGTPVHDRLETVRGKTDEELLNLGMFQHHQPLQTEETISNHDLKRRRNQRNVVERLASQRRKGFPARDEA